MHHSTTLAQLGGNRFLVMTGAKPVPGPGELMLRLPRKARDGIDHVRVQLTPSDEYSLQGFGWNGRNLKEVGEASRADCDNIQAVFTAMTGLETHL